MFSARWVSGVSVCFFEFVKTVTFLGQMANNKIHRHKICAVDDWSGPPRAGSGPGEKLFSGPPGKGGPAKELYPKSERLTLSCRVTGYV